MNLISPKRIIKKKGGPFQAAFEIEKSVDYIITEDDVTFTKSILTVYNSIPVTPFQARIPDIVPIDDGIFAKYHKFQGLINHCINNAEKLNTQLRDLLISIPSIKPPKEELIAMEFMALRNVFSDFFNSYKPLKEQNIYNTKVKRHNITATLYQYITDRNIYTHGILKLRCPDKVFVIQYLEKRTEKVYAELTTEMLQSFLNVSQQLRKTLIDINTFLQANRAK
jgi:hypothetical protein